MFRRNWEQLSFTRSSYFPLVSSHHKDPSCLPPSLRGFGQPRADLTVGAGEGAPCGPVSWAPHSLGAGGTADSVGPSKCDEEQSATEQ